MPGFDEAMTKPAAMPRDAELGQMLEETAKEAQEQVHFHHSQLAMWERVSYAARSGLEALQADQPMQAEEGPMEGQKFDRGPRYYQEQH